MGLAFAVTESPPPSPSCRTTRKEMPCFQFTQTDVVPPVNSIAIDATTPISEVTWRLTFKNQQMSDFVTMTNGLDPVMRRGIPVDINLPSEIRAKSLLDVFKPREQNDPYNPRRKVVLTVHLPSKHEAIYGQDSDILHRFNQMTAFERCSGRTRDIIIRPALDDLVRSFFLRDTLVSATQSTSALGLKAITERVVLCSIFYVPHVNIQAKLSFITTHRGLWVKVGRCCTPFYSAQPVNSDDECTFAWVVLAVLPMSLFNTIFCDEDVSKMYKEPSETTTEIDEAMIIRSRTNSYSSTTSDSSSSAHSASVPSTATSASDDSDHCSEPLASPRKASLTGRLGRGHISGMAYLIM
jgi:hypothetical protein